MLAVIDAMSDKEEAVGRLDCDQAGEVIEFLQIFGDKCHHHKEEKYLFPALAEAGIDPRESEVPVLELEHDKGRRLIRAMANVVSGASVEETFAKNARAYTRMLRQHIGKEDTQLFPLAEARLSPEVAERLAANFDRVEDEVIGQGRHEQFHETLTRLEAQYLRARV